jgi:transposase
VQLDEAKARIGQLEAELAASRAKVSRLEAEVLALRAQVEVLLEQLARNSKNSNLPPSSDPPGKPKDEDKDKPKKDKGERKRKRKRGGQKGHRGNHRELLPPERVNEVVDLFPTHCDKCCKPLSQMPCSDPKRYQSVELPPVEPHVTEYRRHEVACHGCEHHTLAPYDANVIPASPFGPRLTAAIGLFTGVYHLSRRTAREMLGDLMGVTISLGGLSGVEARVADAVGPAVDEAWEQTREATVKHTDGTTWLQGGVAMSLWTVATSMVTVFTILANGRKDTLEPLYGELKGILVSDRATALNFWAMDRRQICWAHLLRKFVSFSERDGRAKAIGRTLLDYTGLVFEYWHNYKDGKLDKQQFDAWMAPVREQFEAELKRAVDAEIAGVSGSCANILEHQPALWTFAEHEGVEPTNNHAERELRAFVLWRKRSFGTQSERGNRFAERLMTVAHTARKQGKNVLEFLTACCRARAANEPAPSLLGPKPNEA